MAIKVLIVDDSAVFRRIAKEALFNLPEVEIAGYASNGKLALAAIRTLAPDLLTLDIDMPEMDGLALLKAIQEEKLPVKAIIVSAFTTTGAAATVKALELGAIDCIAKPESINVDESVTALSASLTPLIKAYGRSIELKKILNHQEIGQTTAATKTQTRTGKQKPEMVLIGISTGGPNALITMLPQLPASLEVPVLIVQHMPAHFTSHLVESLAPKCPLKVKEARHGEIILPGNVYIAPGGKQMRLVSAGGDRKVTQLTDDPPENNCRPAVDYLFRSVANNFPGKAVAVIMTGMGADGTEGLKLLKQNGCTSIAQDQATCTVFGMPMEAIRAGVVDKIVALESIAPEICKAVKGFIR
jgi:two-component system chemotaxis response regulator CheB